MRRLRALRDAPLAVSFGRLDDERRHARHVLPPQIRGEVMQFRHAGAAGAQHGVDLEHALVGEPRQLRGTAQVFGELAVAAGLGRRRLRVRAARG